MTPAHRAQDGIFTRRPGLALGILVAVLLSVIVAMVLAWNGPANAQSAAAQAAAARGLNCTQTDKPNGGFVLDCDPSGGTPSPSSSVSPSSTATVTPSASPSSPTTSPVPSVSPSSSSTPPTGTNCQVNPGRCGYPDASSTGSSGTTTTLSGDRTFSVAGQVVTNTRINGCVTVTAANVTFRNVFFNGVGCFYAVWNKSTGLQIVDSDITCGGANGTGVTATDYSLLRVHIYRCENGLNVGGRVSLVDSLIDQGVTANGAHTDGAQFNQGASDIVIQHNTIITPAPGGTSAIIMWDEGGAQNARVTIAGNLLAGGTYTLYCGREGPVDRVRITDNRFGNFEYGSSNACNSGEVWTGNVRDSDGRALAAA
jgi:hypothetical protein